jgi:hypothetical protein
MMRLLRRLRGLRYDLVNDMALNATWNEAQANARVSQVDSVEPSSLALEATGNIRVNPDDDAYQALRTAFITRAPIDVSSSERIKGT